LIEIGLLLFIITVGVNLLSRLLIWSTKRRAATIVVMPVLGEEVAA
jgi:hypothetical protein